MRGYADRQRRRGARQAGRLAFLQHLQTQAALVRFDQQLHDQTWQERHRPTEDEPHKGIAVTRVHWPEPRPCSPTYNTERLIETDAQRKREKSTFGRFLNTFTS